MTHKIKKKHILYGVLLGLIIIVGYPLVSSKSYDIECKTIESNVGIEIDDAAKIVSRKGWRFTLGQDNLRTDYPLVIHGKSCYSILDKTGVLSTMNDGFFIHCGKSVTEECHVMHNTIKNELIDWSVPQRVPRLQPTVGAVYPE